MYWSGQQPSKFAVDCSQTLVVFNGISRHKVPVIIGSNQDINWFGVVEVVCQFQALWKLCLAKANRLPGSSLYTVLLPRDFVFVNTVLRHCISVSGNLCPRSCWCADFQNWRAVNLGVKLHSMRHTIVNFYCRKLHVQELNLICWLPFAVCRSTVPLVVDLAIVVVVTVTCSFGIPLGMLFLFGLLCSSEGLSILRKSIGDAFHHSVGISLFWNNCSHHGQFWGK